MYESGTVSFDFYALTSSSISRGDTIEILVNLYPESGNMEEEGRTAICTLSESANPSNGVSIQIRYECKIEELEEVYTSLRYNSSQNIAGVPTDDEIALNPVLTDQAIENQEIIDYQAIEVPPTFIINSIDHSNCSSTGKIIFKGELSSNVTIVTKFTIPLTYPEGISMTCSFDTDTLECKLDRDLSDSMLIEQTVIKDGTKDLFILQSINEAGVNCQDSVLLEAVEKIEVDISFRQVSTIRESTDGLTFFFAAFVNNQIQANTEIIMKVLILDETVEKNATCTLRETVSPSNGEPLQGDFDCQVSLTDEEKENMGDNIDLIISPDNGNIGGCSDLSSQEKSPRLTDLAIAESEEKSDDSLGKVLDFSIAENKESRPPTFEVTSFNLSNCENTGKFKVKGTFSEDISEELTFNLPFSYPSSEIKCTVKDVIKDEEIEVKCRVQKGFRKVKSFVLEPRLIKKKCVEKLYIKGNRNIQLNTDGEFKCQNFNEIKLLKAKNRLKNSIFSFLQLSRPHRLFSSGRRILDTKTTKAIYIVFIALRKTKESSTDSFSAGVSAQGTKRRLRILQSGTTQDLGEFELTCELNQSAGDTCSFGCSPTSGEDVGEPALLEFDDDNDQIQGLPEEIPVETNATLDLTNLSNLQLVENLVSINMTNINSSNCSTIGKFLIEGDLYDNSNTLKDFNKSFVVSLSNPDSSGVCEIDSIENDKIIILCDNTEQFTATSVMISSQLVQDANGNPIFKFINDKTSSIPFACAISDNSTLPLAYSTPIDNVTDDTSDSVSETTSDATSDTTSEATSQATNPKYYRNDSSNGLSGGAIAGIIVSCVVVAVIISVLIFFVKKNALLAARKPAITDNFGNSTINNLNASKISPIS